MAMPSLLAYIATWGWGSQDVRSILGSIRKLVLGFAPTYAAYVGGHSIFLATVQPILQ